jgi:hypothetical protein
VCDVENVKHIRYARLQILTLVILMMQGRVNVSATYNTRHQTVDGSVVARGEIWRFEASRGGSTYGNNSGPPFLIQLGPIIFVRDSTFLFPINLSEQHLVWYGYDRKVLFILLIYEIAHVHYFLLIIHMIDENIV